MIKSRTHIKQNERATILKVIAGNQSWFTTHTFYIIIYIHIDEINNIVQTT